MDRDPLTEMIIAAAIKVHRTLGPGRLESAYQPCLVYELRKQNLKLAIQRPLSLTYESLKIDCAYTMDIVVEEQVVLELKAVERIERVHISQLLTYLKLAGFPIGLLLNFNVPVMIQGIRRVINNDAI